VTRPPSFLHLVRLSAFGLSVVTFDGVTHLVHYFLRGLLDFAGGLVDFAFLLQLFVIRHYTRRFFYSSLDLFSFTAQGYLLFLRFLDVGCSSISYDCKPEAILIPLANRRFAGVNPPPQD